ASGQFFLLARNPAQFAARYPGVTVNGVYAGKLDNGGEALTLSRALGGTVLSVSYGDGAPWPAAADGFGFSLVPKNAVANPDPNNGANWRASAQPLGSPGADDPASGIPPVVINEALTASVPPLVDTIELYNPTASAADNVSFGRYVISTGEEQFPAQISRTFGAANSGPRIGPVVISEIMYHPPPGGDEFVEVKNISGAAVPLFDVVRPTNTWKFTGLNYTFPTNVTLESNAFL